MNTIDETRTGCKAFELEIGTEFSCNGGIIWLVVRTVPQYISEDRDCTELRFAAAPSETASLLAWETITLDDHSDVLLQRVLSSL